MSTNAKVAAGSKPTTQNSSKKEPAKPTSKISARIKKHGPYDKLQG